MKIRKWIKQILKTARIDHYYTLAKKHTPGVVEIYARTDGADNEREAAYMITDRLVMAVDHIRREPESNGLIITVNSPSIGEYIPYLLITEDIV